VELLVFLVGETGRLWMEVLLVLLVVLLLVLLEG